MAESLSRGTTLPKGLQKRVLSSVGVRNCFFAPGRERATKAPPSNPKKHIDHRQKFWNSVQRRLPMGRPLSVDRHPLVT